MQPINLSNIKISWDRRELNPGPLVAEQERYPSCYAATSVAQIFVFYFLNSLVLNELSHRDWPTSRLVSCFNFLKSSNSSKCFFFIGWSAWLNFHTEGISTKWSKRKMKTMAGPQWRDRFNESKDKGNWLFLSVSKSWKKLKDYSGLISKGSTNFKRMNLKECSW